MLQPMRSQRVRYDLATEHQHCSLPLYTTLFCCGSFSGMRIEFFPETLAFCLVHYSLFGNKVQSRLQHQDISAVEGEVSSPVTKVSSVWKTGFLKSRFSIITFKFEQNINMCTLWVIWLSDNQILDLAFIQYFYLYSLFMANFQWHNE